MDCGGVWLSFELLGNVGWAEYVNECMFVLYGYLLGGNGCIFEIFLWRLRLCWVMAFFVVTLL